MSNERERLAREWAQMELDNAGEFSDKGRIAAAEHIMATTKEPTMADVEWDDKHFLAGATLDAEESAEEMVMCGFTRDGEIYVVEPAGGKRGYWPMPGDLTPNGKRYELAEVTGDGHPETLRTLEDYVGAPIGTVVAAKTGRVWSKDGWCDWETTNSSSSRLNRHMAGTERQVLRWGWSE